MFRNMKLGVKLMTIGCGLTLIPLFIIFVMGFRYCFSGVECA